MNIFFLTLVPGEIECFRHISRLEVLILRN